MTDETHPTTTAELQAAVTDAVVVGARLRVVGGGTWLDAGRPVIAERRISTQALRGVVEYVPGDLVITVRAGTTLAELAEITAAHGQWLALDPYTSPPGLTRATIGATIATASHGPLSLGYGRARDLVLGLSFVTGTGMPVRAGGRVVKNVAGFDLVRLITGAWGTLGIITEVSLRLHARPAVDETFAVAIDLPEAADARDLALARLVEQLNSAPLLATTNSLAALVLLTHGASGSLRESVALPHAPVLLLARLVGNRARVEAQRRALSTLGDVTTVDTASWHAIRSLERGNTTVRVTDAPQRTAGTLRRVSTWMEHADASPNSIIVEPMRGAVRVACDLPASSERTDVSLPARTIAERLPSPLWASQASAGGDPISRQLRERFDPAGLLNPGLFDSAAHDAPVGAAR